MRAVPDARPFRPASARAAEVAQALGLKAHPEGGGFREVFRSGLEVRPADGRGARTALTTIDFLLADRGVSRWHQVDSDEVWHFHEGAPLELWVLTPDLEDLQLYRLGPIAEGARRHETVSAGWWQAARTTGDYSLVGCTVGPGFDFADFRLAVNDRSLAERLGHRHPSAAALL